MLSNESGECETAAEGVVLGRPSRPVGPVEVSRLFITAQVLLKIKLQNLFGGFYSFLLFSSGTLLVWQCCPMPIPFFPVQYFGDPP